MSEIKRYDIFLDTFEDGWNSKESPNGDWVEYSDHAAEVERLSKIIDEDGTSLANANYKILNLRDEIHAKDGEIERLRSNLSDLVSDAVHDLRRRLEELAKENAALKEEAEKERKRRLQSPVDRLHNICFGLSKCPNCGFDFEDDEQEQVPVPMPKEAVDHIAALTAALDEATTTKYTEDHGKYTDIHLGKYERDYCRLSKTSRALCERMFGGGNAS